MTAWRTSASGSAAAPPRVPTLAGPRQPRALADCRASRTPARSEALYNGETYVMGIDSHTTAEGWDTIMIDMFRRIANLKAIITAYLHVPNSQQEEGGDNAVVQTEPTRMTSICARGASAWGRP